MSRRDTIQTFKIIIGCKRVYKFTKKMHKNQVLALRHLPKIHL